MANICNLGITINKFYYKKKLCLVILYKVNINFKMCLYHTILSLNLAIYLKIENN